MERSEYRSLILRRPRSFAGSERGRERPRTSENQAVSTDATKLFTALNFFRIFIRYPYKLDANCLGARGDIGLVRPLPATRQVQNAGRRLQVTVLQ